jgi:aspartate/methionine/tyrosine aminotransferase
MPRFPEISVAAGTMPASIFARLYGKLAQHQGEIFPFHLGDTCLPPPHRSLLGNQLFDDSAAGKLYCYGAPAGDARFIDALVAKLAAKNGLEVEPRQLQITAGATHALACGLRAVLDPGDDVLVCSPFWPIIRGQILSAGARPVEVPFTSTLYDDPDTDVRALLESYRTPRTTAIYLINPNNPDGKVLRARDLDAIAAFAADHGLWVFSDEVYEDFAYDGRQHLSFATLPGMAERTITSFSFSKTYGLAGLRIGYIVGPRAVLDAVWKISNHTIYNAPLALQRAALAALENGEEFIAAARARYVHAREVSMAALTGAGIPGHKPDGGSYVFIDLSRWIDEASASLGSIAVLEKLALQGILLAPGEAFGKSYRNWARLCYTSVQPERLDAGLAKIVNTLKQS